MTLHPPGLASGLLVLGILVGWLVPALPAQEFSERKTATVDPSIYDSYVGQYELYPKATITLRRFRQRLTAQITGQPPLEVYPASATTFFWKVVDAQFTIQKDKEGKVTGLDFEQGAIKLKAKKIASAPANEEDLKEPDETFKSPRLAALAKDQKSGNKTALEQFWKEMQDKAPLVEPIAGDTRHSWVTFVWRGDAKTRRVLLEGGPSSREEQVLLARLADTDLWYRTEQVANAVRCIYSFQVNMPEKMPEDLPGKIKMMGQYQYIPKPDPLNPRDVSVQSMLFSLLELPGAPPQPWLRRLPDVLQGALTQHKIKSEILKQERAVTVYTPANFDPKTSECGLLVLFDGPFYLDSNEIPGPVILDNLIGKKKIPPLVAVFVKHLPFNRNKELCCSETFADFVAKELVPWAQKNYHTSSEPKRRIVGGLSAGGLMASFCGLRHSEVFGNVLSQSGSYQWYPGAFDEAPKRDADAEPGVLTRQFVTAPARPVRFYLEAGSFEHNFPESLLAENRRLRDVLLAKGYSVHYTEFNGGHDYQTWRGSFADALITLTGPSAQK